MAKMKREIIFRLYPSARSETSSSLLVYIILLQLSKLFLSQNNVPCLKEKNVADLNKGGMKLTNGSRDTAPSYKLKTSTI